MKYGWLDEYLLAKKGAEKDFKIEWKWHRYLIRDKLFAAIYTDKTGRQIITLKCEVAFGSILRGQHNNIVAGYYMNKEHWNSVYLDSDVPDNLIKEIIDMSYTNSD